MGITTHGERGLSLTDVPKSISSVAGSQMDRIQIWPNHHIVGTIQKLGDSMQVGETSQILLIAISDCKNQITAVARQGNEELQRRGYFPDGGDRWRRKTQWYDF